jgi:hypothetical protein
MALITPLPLPPITPVSIVLNLRTGMIFRVQYLARMSVIGEADSDHEPEPPPPVLTEVEKWVKDSVLEP